MSHDEPVGAARPREAGTLRRRLGVGDAVVVGLGAMFGAGVFTAIAPAARAAGSGLLIGPAVAAVVAYCDAMSSARPAARYPSSGGAYVYGRERLGPFWGFLAGWTFVVGKTASCAAMALTVGIYIRPDRAHAVAVAVVVGVTAINWFGVQKSVWATRVVVVFVSVVLIGVVVAGLGSGSADFARLELGPDTTVAGVLQAAGLLFFAFAGYARIATLGEEVRDPAHTVPRAVPISLALALGMYALVAVSALLVLGPGRLAGSAAPLAEMVQVAGVRWLEPVVRAGAAVAALGALLALLLGVSRTTLAMARDRHLPAVLAAVHPRFAVPRRAELAVGIAAAALAATADMRAAIGFSSFGVLLYYAVANAAAWTLGRADRRRLRPVAALGFAGCLVLAVTLPVSAVVAGAVVIGMGALSYGSRRLVAHGRAAGR